MTNIERAMTIFGHCQNVLNNNFKQLFTEVEVASDGYLPRRELLYTQTVR